MENTQNKDNNLKGYILDEEFPFLKAESVKKPVYKPLYEPNEILRRHIYIKHKSNIHKFSKELGVHRQYIWAIISGRLRPSIPMARKICDLLGVEDTRLIFLDGSLEYPDFKTADQLEEKDGEG